MTGRAKRHRSGPTTAFHPDALSITVGGCNPPLARHLASAARHALSREGIARGRLHVLVVTDGEMRRQHRRWMNDPTPTDVLTFDLRDLPDAKAVDAQILICRDVARRAARLREHDWRNELALYVVHGCLHLCGHDDATERAAARMHAREDDLLTELGIGPVFSPRPRRKKSRDTGRSRVLNSRRDAPGGIGDARRRAGPPRSRKTSASGGRRRR